ncbi:MAG: hypothetical protein HY315_04375 [Acidobacteria bacterium]|nr:hypothetical protein [Acidobacteriota bacterium]
MHREVAGCGGGALVKVRYFLFLLALLAVGIPAYATSVRAVELDELVGSSDQIFLGRVVEVRQGTLAGFDLNYTEYTFAVSDWIKGGSGDTLKVRQLGRGAGAPVLPGIPAYKKGAEILLFIHRPSRIGLTSPVGMDQGYYPVEKDGNGDRTVHLRTMNASVERLQSRLQAGKSPAPGLPATDRMPLDEFVSLVRRLK